MTILAVSAACRKAMTAQPRGWHGYGLTEWSRLGLMGGELRPGLQQNRANPRFVDASVTDLGQIQSGLRAAASVVIESEFQMSTILELYDVRDTGTIREFLQDHPAVAAVLVEARSRIEKWFPGAPVTLRICGGDEERQLCAMIQTELEPGEGLRQLDAFDEEWWLEASRPVAGQLLIDVEYVE